MPPMEIPWAGVLAWVGGALFTAKILMNPFVAAKYPFLTFERGAARRLPVELTMANDLPVMLSSAPIRGRIPYGHNPTMLLYFLDQNAFPPSCGRPNAALRMSSGTGRPRVSRSTTPPNMAMWWRRWRGER